MAVSWRPSNGEYTALAEGCGMCQRSYRDARAVESRLDLSGNEYRLDDSAAHFLKNAKLICSDAYVPDIDMLVRSHVEQTQGVETYECTMKNQTSVHIDVSGQHNEMKKWIRLYQGLTGVVFVADICAYDQVRRPHCASYSHKRAYAHIRRADARWPSRCTCVSCALVRVAVCAGHAVR